MAIENVGKRVLCLCMGTVRLKPDKETEQEGKKRRMNMEVRWHEKKEVPTA